MDSSLFLLAFLYCFWAQESVLDSNIELYCIMRNKITKTVFGFVAWSLFFLQDFLDPWLFPAIAIISSQVSPREISPRGCFQISETYDNSVFPNEEV
ncbi:putative signal peptide protein [Puccinia sorghi]|uniref:Putative signal peptide protein n=1 Tax=Puccinia sorghi TaxID=27349 RepID=A0A0L6VLL1_9BASI|nr:putative signal peptide protein [Puccinia sorghi]